MVRVGGKEGNGAAEEDNGEAEERKRLKRLAIWKKMVSDAPAKAFSVALSPSRTVTKHHGRDILKKSQRKNRFLFSFPALLAPISGGKIGDLKDLGTKNPILYLDFPQGQMKLFGTIYFPKNRYLTLQFSKGGKNVMCEDYFDTMIVFSDAWWIGRKDDNPEEVRLEFPKELNVGQQAEYDFKGGAGATCERKPGVNKPETKCVEQQYPKPELETDLSDGQNNLKDLIEVTPTRHSARTSGKTFRFAEASSGDDSVENNSDEKSEEEEKKTENSCHVVFDKDNEDAASHNQMSKQIQQSAVPDSVPKSKEWSRNNQSSLVQATISTLFKKVVEKKAPKKLRHSPSLKVSSLNLQHSDSKQNTDQVKVQGRRKKGMVIEERKDGKESTPMKKRPEVEDDDIEEFSSTSQDNDGSDEDWAA